MAPTTSDDPNREMLKLGYLLRTAERSGILGSFETNLISGHVAMDDSHLSAAVETILDCDDDLFTGIEGELKLFTRAWQDIQRLRHQVDGPPRERRILECLAICFYVITYRVNLSIDSLPERPAQLGGHNYPAAGAQSRYGKSIEEHSGGEFNTEQPESPSEVINPNKEGSEEYSFDDCFSESDTGEEQKSGNGESSLDDSESDYDPDDSQSDEGEPRGCMASSNLRRRKKGDDLFKEYHLGIY